jgi:hypothetical protein
MSTDKDKDWLNSQKKPDDLSKPGNEQNRASLSGDKEHQLRNPIPSGGSGMQSEHSGNNPGDYHQGSHVSGQNGMHNQQQSSNLSNQGMQGQSNQQAPGGHYGQDATGEKRSQTGGTSLNENEVKSSFEDKGQGNAGVQGQYSGSTKDIKHQEDATRQRKDFTGSDLDKNADRQGPDALNRQTDKDDANRQRSDYFDLSDKDTDQED